MKSTVASLNRKKLTLCYLAWGNSSHTYRKLNWFAENGHKIHLITHTSIDQNIGDIKNIEIHRLPYFTLRGKSYFPIGNFYEIVSFPFILRKIKKLVNRIQPDILHSHNLLYPGWMGACIDFHPFVVSPMNGDVIMTPRYRPMQYRFSRFALKKIDYLTAISRLLIEASKKLGAAPEKCLKLHWGFEFDRFNMDYSQFEKTRIKKRLEIPEDTHVVLSTRSINADYDTETIVRAAKIVSDEIPNIVFLFAWHSASVRYMAFLNQLVDELNVRPVIRFVGSIPRKDIDAYYKASDVFVSASLWDGGPNSVIEAMLCGNGIVVSALPIFDEYRNAENFKFAIAPQRSPESIAKHVIDYIQNPEKKNAYCAHNYKILRQHFNYEHNMKQLENIYYSLV